MRDMKFPRPVKVMPNGCITAAIVRGRFGTVTGWYEGGEYKIIKYEGERWRGHRLSFHLNIKRIPKLASEGNYILHKCDNKFCINPDHLYEGTTQDNMQDRWSRHPDSDKWRLDTSERMKLRKGERHWTQMNSGQK